MAQFSSVWHATVLILLSGTQSLWFGESHMGIKLINHKQVLRHGSRSMAVQISQQLQPSGGLRGGRDLG